MIFIESLPTLYLVVLLPPNYISHNIHLCDIWLFGVRMKQYEPVPPPVTWFGSKSRLVKEIVKHFPDHQTYVDVFGGSGAVLLGKKPSKVEVDGRISKGNPPPQTI